MEVADSKAGTRVVCRHCGRRVGAPDALEKPTSRLTARRQAPRTAPAKPVPPPKRRRRDDEDDEEVRRSPVRARRQRDEDEEEEDDRGRPAAKSSAALLWIVLGLLILGGAGVGLYFALRPNDEQRAPLANNTSHANSKDIKTPEQRPTTDKSFDAKPPDSKQPDKRPPDRDPDDGGEQPVAASGNEIFQHVLKSTVWVVNVMPNGQSTGTGSLVDKTNRLILTNYHVVHGHRGLYVFFPVYQDNKLVRERDTYLQQIQKRTIDSIRGHVIFQDPKRDLAMIQIDRVPDNALPLAVAHKSVDTGYDVHSVGNPGVSGSLWVYTPGKVRSVYRKKWQAAAGTFTLDLDAMIVETQSATNPGDSGGPLVDNQGELVGVTQGGAVKGNSISFFIDVSEATDFIDKACKAKNLTWTRGDRVLVVRRKGNVADLVKKLESPDAKVRAQAAQNLGEMGFDARLAVVPLVKLLKDSDDFNRRLAQAALAKIGAPDKGDVSALREALRDASVPVRSYAAEALGLIGPEARSAGSALLEALKDKEPTVRLNAARSLGQVHYDNKQAVIAALSAALKDPDKGVRVAAAEARTRAFALGPSDVAVLVDLLKHEDMEARAIAARALERMGRRARAAIPALIEAVRNNTAREVDQAAIQALGAFGPDAKEAVPALMEAMKEEELRPAATLTLARIGADAAPAVKLLAEALFDDNRTTRSNSLLALSKIGAGARAAAPDLARLLKGKDRDLRLHVVDVLEKIGPAAAEAVPEMIQVLGEYITEPRGAVAVELYDKDLHTRLTEALGKIGKPAVTPLRQALRETNKYIRLGAIMALGNIGPDARSAALDLRNLALGDQYVPARQEAAKAYQKVTAKKVPRPPKDNKPPKK
jgi:HEAT repeat protein